MYGFLALFSSFTVVNFSYFMQTPISAVVICFNQENKIQKTLEALFQVTDDVVVVDSLSTDRTPMIAKAMGARVFSQSWLGYPAQKNWGNQQACHNWIISIDDDEVLDNELIANIKRLFAQTPDFDALDLPFQTYFCGQRIRFGGWNPESHIRVFDKTKISWNTDAVHEGLTIETGHKILKIKGFVKHFTVDTLEQFYAKTEKYGNLYAQKAIKSGKKSSWMKQYASPVFRFLVEYIFRLGFLDGYFGWIIAKENARYTYLKYKR
jgi:glycosyltransferase involved in cell wall biosynthesis